LRQQTTATRWRRQLPSVQFNRSRRDAGALDRLAEASDGRKLTAVTICHELSDADQIIKFENGGTD
jgi:hypothetical protein